MLPADWLSLALVVLGGGALGAIARHRPSDGPGLLVLTATTGLLPWVGRAAFPGLGPISWAPTALLAVFLQLLLVLAVIDRRSLTLPDPLVLAVAVLGLAWVWLPGPGAPSPLSAVAGGLVAIVLVGGVRSGYLLLTDREGMGLGDVKLAAALGLWIGGDRVGLLIFFAACITLLAMMLHRWRRRLKEWPEPVPFGPGLNAAAILLVSGQIFQIL